MSVTVVHRDNDDNVITTLAVTDDGLHASLRHRSAHAAVITAAKSVMACAVGIFTGLTVFSMILGPAIEAARNDDQLLPAMGVAITLGSIVFTTLVTSLAAPLAALSTNRMLGLIVDPVMETVTVDMPIGVSRHGVGPILARLVEQEHNVRRISHERLQDLLQQARTLALTNADLVDWIIDANMVDWVIAVGSAKNRYAVDATMPSLAQWLGDAMPDGVPATVTDEPTDRERTAAMRRLADELGFGPGIQMERAARLLADNPATCTRVLLDDQHWFAGAELIRLYATTEHPDALADVTRGLLTLHERIARREAAVQQQQIEQAAVEREQRQLALSQANPSIADDVDRVLALEQPTTISRP